MKEWAPFKIIMALSSLAVRCKTFILFLFISLISILAILDISPRCGVSIVGPSLFFIFSKSSAMAVIPSPSMSRGLLILGISSRTSSCVSLAKERPGPMITISTI